MAPLTELARGAGLDPPQVAHLERLLASWGLLADLCFSDLLLWARRPHQEGLLVLAHVRPTTSQTIYRTDWTGQSFTDEERPLVAGSFATGEILEGEIGHTALAEPVRVLSIPVTAGVPFAVLTRESAPSIGRQPGELERVYVDVFHRFARMIAAGTFPFEGDPEERELSPRVGDGVLLLDDAGRIEFSSPNAVSALLRLGVHRSPEGLRIGALGVEDSFVAGAMAEQRPRTVEVEHGPDATVLARCVPLLAGGRTTGAVVLTRDISELRRRDRLLKSKDAMIREVHHRVKNNLATVSSLLRLQARRMASPEAKAALEESVRRIGSIALVHETLARDPGSEVAFAEIVDPLVRMVEEGLTSPERPMRVAVTGDAGELAPDVATPLAIVLVELLQNVVEHAFPEERGGAGCRATVELANDGHEVVVRVTDDGVGVPEGFDPAASTGLGLRIVQTLVATELAGSLEVLRGGGGPERAGTSVEVRVPVAEVESRAAGSA